MGNFFGVFFRGLISQIFTGVSWGCLAAPGGVLQFTETYPAGREGGRGDPYHSLVFIITFPVIVFALSYNVICIYWTDNDGPTCNKAEVCWDLYYFLYHLVLSKVCYTTPNTNLAIRVSAWYYYICIKVFLIGRGTLGGHVRAPLCITHYTTFIWVKSRHFSYFVLLIYDI